MRVVRVCCCGRAASNASNGGARLMAHAGDVGKRERTTTTHHEWTPPGVKCSNEERRQGNELRGRVQDGGEGSVPADSPPLSTYKDGKR